jgi:hypothetical protein
MYSFHGQCDLVLGRSTDFGSGLGIDVHARTEIIDSWSLISNLAVRLGDDIFEVANDGSHYFNALQKVQLPLMIAGKYEVSRSSEAVDGINDEGEKAQSMTDVYRIDLTNGEYIKIQNYRKMISVRIEAILANTGGMLGVHGRSGMIGRDGVTHVKDENEMGFQWQVQDNEAMIFHEIRAPQYPQSCVMPASKTTGRRQLRVSDDQFEIEAAESCTAAGASPEMHPFCVQDVVRTGDKNMASAYAFGF